MSPGVCLCSVSIVKKYIYEYSYYVHMSNINISIKDEAYRFLQSHKGKKSFSDVILEFKEWEKSRDILRFFGVLKTVHWKKEESDALRKEFEERL